MFLISIFLFPHVTNKECQAAVSSSTPPRRSCTGKPGGWGAYINSLGDLSGRWQVVTCEFSGAGDLWTFLVLVISMVFHSDTSTFQQVSEMEAFVDLVKSQVVTCWKVLVLECSSSGATWPCNRVTPVWAYAICNLTGET